MTPLVALFALILFTSSTLAAPLLHHIVPKVVPGMQPLDHLASTNRIDFAIELPLRNPDGLGRLIAKVYDPQSSSFRHYLTAQQFTEQFGPDASDYAAIIGFANTNGLRIRGRHSNRMILDLNGSVADIERSLHVKMYHYRHPTGGRIFYAPNSEPTVNLKTPILSISGLDNYALPQPLFVRENVGLTPTPALGSAPGGSYMGGDFRAAYVPDTTMTGAGQSVGLLQFDGYTAGDISYYAQLAGLPTVPLTNVLLDGFSGRPTGDGGEVEVSLDIEMAMSMAPGLSSILVYEAGPAGSWHDVLNRMATDDLAKQLSCSWYIPEGLPDPVATQIFQEMAAQGQSFFVASGDYDAYTGLIPFPSDSTNVTAVGGTTLTTLFPGGPWSSETVWNSGYGIGSGGGISESYAIPPWQTNINMAANEGSTTQHNVPDVALIADNVYVRVDNANEQVRGTSCAAPLWAGFAALVNQRATVSGRPPVGFINYALDMIGSGAGYTNCFHDITNGNNTSFESPNKFDAVPGYDLCTGWGTPMGENLIDALAVPDALHVTPNGGFTSIGGSGGPFTVTGQLFVLTNSGTNSLNWSIVTTAPWLTGSPSSGTIAEDTNSGVVVSLGSDAYTLPIGTYVATIAFSNSTTHVAQTREFELQIVPSVLPTILQAPSSQSAPVGSNVTFLVAAGGTPPFSFQWQYNGLDIPGATNANLTLSNVTIDQTGTYTVDVNNTLGAANASALLTVGYSPTVAVQPLPQEISQGSNAFFQVTASGTPPFNYQWFLYGAAIPLATNSSLELTNVQAANSGPYRVQISSPFGSVLSSNVNLIVDLRPVIIGEPASQSVSVGSNAVLIVRASGVASTLPSITSGTLQLWLRADAGVITNNSGQVIQWQDQSGNANDAFQANQDLEPVLASMPYSPGQPVVRFNGLQNSTNGNYMHGLGQVNVPNAMTAFTVYNAFSTLNNEDVTWDIGTPGTAGADRGSMTTGGYMHFTFWSYDFSAPFILPTNTYRMRIDQLDTNLDRINMYDISESSSTNFTLAVNGAEPFGAGYYLGGLDTSIPYVGTSRNFDGDIAEIICYSGGISDSDRIAVTTYLAQKYLQTISTGDLAYQWQFDGTNIAGATNSALSLSDVQFSEAGTYAVTISNDIGVTVSSNAVVRVGNAPSIVTQPSSVEAKQGSNVSFSIAAVGDGPFTYQWRLNNYPLPSATNAVLTVTNIQESNNGVYSATVTTPFGSVLSSNATLTVDLFPIILSEPVGATVMVGTNITLSIGVESSSATLPTVTSGSLQLWLRADAGVVTNSDGAVSQWNDQSGNFNNASQPNALLQPTFANALGLNGKAVVRFNGIQNNTNGSYMHGVGELNLPNAMTAFTVYNAFSAVNSENVLWDLGIPGQAGGSRGALITDGDLRFTFWSADFSAPFVVPTNTYRLRIDQLETNLTTLTMYDVTGSDSTNFVLGADNAQSVGAGYYLGGLDTSISYVGTSRNFDGDLAEILCYEGSLSAADRTAVSGYLQQKYFGYSAHVTYQWEFDGTAIGGATNSSLALTDLQVTNAGTYTVLVGNSAGVTTSSNAILLVGTPPAIISQPQSQEVKAGTNVLFTVGTGGTGPFTYQWYLSETALNGATNSVLSLTNVQEANAGAYSVSISTPFGEATSSTAALTVDTTPRIIKQPMSQAVLAGTNLTLSVAVLGGSDPYLPAVTSGSLQLWLRADSGVITNSDGFVSQWEDQSGNGNDAFQTNSSLQPTLASTNLFGYKSAVRFNGIQNSSNGSYMHGSGLLNLPDAMTTFTVYNAFSTVNAENVIWDIGIPGGYGGSRAATITDGDLHFSFWAYDFSAPFIIPTNSYRIRIDQLDTNLDTLTMSDLATDSETNFSMSVNGSVSIGAGYYLGGLDTSLLNVGTSRNFDGDLAEIICYQGSLSTNDEVAVTEYLQNKYLEPEGQVSFQWQFDGTNISGATNSVLTMTAVQLGNSGTYSVAVSNLNGVTFSSNAVIQVGYPLAITSQPVSAEVKQGTNVAFSVAVSGSGPIAYQWYLSGSAMTGQTNSWLTLNDVQGSNDGSYYVLIETPFGAVLSSNAILTVDTLPWIYSQPQNQAALAGSDVTFTAMVAGGNLPPVTSGNLQLWLKADAGVVTNSGGLINRWADLSGNSNDALQPNLALEPSLATSFGLSGAPVVRFNGIQNSTNGSYMHGVGVVNVPNAMTAFTVYNAFSDTNDENVFWDIGVPAQYGGSRGALITGGDLRFTFWAYDFSAPFVVPTNSYRLRVDQLDTNLDTLNMSDITLAGSTNFTLAVYGADVPSAGYYLGGLDTSLANVGDSRNFDGDLAEILCYSGTLSPSDQNAVTAYLVQKYFLGSSPGRLSFQWQFDGSNIVGATNSSLTLHGVTTNDAGTYAVLVSNQNGAVISSNALLSVGYAPVIVSQPLSQSVESNCDAGFNVQVEGSSPMSYQWTKNNIALSNGTNSALELTNIEVSDTGTYSVIITNMFGSVSSDAAQLALAIPPVASNVVVFRFAEGGVRIGEADLLRNSTVAPYDQLSVVALSSNSVAGGNVILDGQWIFYTPPTNSVTNDSFAFTISDGHCGFDVGTAIVEIKPDDPQPTDFGIATTTNGALQLNFEGIPGAEYEVQYTESLTPSDWQTLSYQNADEFGLLHFTDQMPTNAFGRFYRAVAK